jgi:hypothetical protein
VLKIKLTNSFFFLVEKIWNCVGQNLTRQLRSLLGQSCALLHLAMHPATPIPRHGAMLLYGTHASADFSISYRGQQQPFPPQRLLTHRPFFSPINRKRRSTWKHAKQLQVAEQTDGLLPPTGLPDPRMNANVKEL